MDLNNHDFEPLNLITHVEGILNNDSLMIQKEEYLDFFNMLINFIGDFVYWKDAIPRVRLGFAYDKSWFNKGMYELSSHQFYKFINPLLKIDADDTEFVRGILSLLIAKLLELEATRPRNK